MARVDASQYANTLRLPPPVERKKISINQIIIDRIAQTILITLLAASYALLEDKDVILSITVTFVVFAIDGAFDVFSPKDEDGNPTGNKALKIAIYVLSAVALIFVYCYVSNFTVEQFKCVLELLTPLVIKQVLDTIRSKASSDPYVLDPL